jgi:2-methylcitrate dehydratase PrpD
MGRTDDFARYAAGSSFAALPAVAVERTKLIVCDELACAYVGREHPPGRLAARYVQGFGAAGPSTIAGTATRTAPALAALANGTAGHGDEFDGAHVTDGHPGASVVHASLAVAEAASATGADLINAVALGYDVGTRLVHAVGGAYALRYRHHVHSDHLHGYGAAAAAARLKRLSAEGQRHALALTAGQAGGLAVIFAERRHMSKSLSNGLAAQAGVMSAELAAAGFEGHDAILDAQHGPLDWSDDVPADLGADLGQDFAVMGANFKFYSAGYPIHAPVEGALRILREAGLTVEDIAAVTVGMNAGAIDTVRDRKMHSIDVAHMTAVAIVYGGLDFDVAHSDSAHASPAVAAMKGRIGIVADPELDRTQPRGRGARVTMVTRSGERHERLIEFPKGHCRRGGVDWEALDGKWRGLLTARMGAATYERYLGACQRLERLEDLSALTAPLRKEAAG